MLCFLGINIFTHASEQSSKEEAKTRQWITEQKSAIRDLKWVRNINMGFLGASLLSVGHYMFRNPQKSTRSFPAWSLCGILFFLQSTAMFAEDVERQQLRLMKVENPEEYESTPKIYYDAPIWDGGRRVNEDGSYYRDEGDRR